MSAADATEEAPSLPPDMKMQQDVKESGQEGIEATE